MKKSELILTLTELPGDPGIYIWADHGQNFEDATAVKLISDPEELDAKDLDEPSAIIYGL